MFQFNTVEEALEDLRNGKIILCTDDPDRENEGDFICAAEFATTQNVNFMATHGKGLICMPMSEEYVQKLQFPQMVTRNTDNHETAFTVSIDGVDYTEKLAAVLQSNDIRSVTLTRMEVPCCGGMEFAIRTALGQAGKEIPFRTVVLSIDGAILEER